MTAPTHAAIGYMIAQVFVQKGWLPQELANHATLVGVIGATIPDIDVFAVWKLLRHRANSPFHMPLLWLAGLLAALWYLATMNFRMQYELMMLFGTGVFSHFICDSIDYSSGICWLWPFTRKRFHFWKYSMPDPKTFADVIGAYRRNPTLLLEVAIDTVSYILFRRFH